MLIPSSQIMTLLNAFAQVFDPRVWQSAMVLFIGAILAPGKRTVSTVLTAVGLADDRQFQRFHRVLNRARWSELEVSQILLRLAEYPDRFCEASLIYSAMPPEFG